MHDAPQSHGHGHAHRPDAHDAHDAHDAAFWDAMYRRRAQERPWDPAPNETLAALAAGLPPGDALDVACGEGADAVWLADRGWRVTAVDHAAAALERGRAHDPAGRVAWVRADLDAWTPPADAYDLVTSHFLHLMPGPRPVFFAGLARAVRPGGTLLFVAHHPSDAKDRGGHAGRPDLAFTAAEIVAALPAGWTVVRDETLPFPNGRTDMLLVARRG